MAMEIVGLIIVILHVTAISMIVLWFAFGKPKSWAQFCAVFKEQILGIKRTKDSLSPKA